MTGGGIKYTNYKKEKQVAMEKTKSPRESRPVEDVGVGGDSSTMERRMSNIKNECHLKSRPFDIAF